MDISNCIVYYSSELKDYGFPENKIAFIGNVFYVYVVNQRGTRWVHQLHHDGILVEYDEHCNPYYKDVQAIAIAECKLLVSRIIEVGVICLDYWHETHPVFNSETYRSPHIREI